MLQFVLLGMQAAGMVMDWMGTQDQIRMGRMGAKIEQAGIKANIALTRAQAEDASVQAMQNLRKTLGSQAAIMAARGTRSGVGSALAITSESVGAFNKDEQIRKMNQIARENELKAGMVMSNLHQQTFETQMTNALRQRFFDKLPTNPASIKAFMDYGTTPTKGGSGGNYGMTSV